MNSNVRLVREPLLILVEGRDYLYTPDWPPGCKGHVYRLLKFVEYQPHKTKLVLVECQSGPDLGLVFVCSEANFASRYVDLPPPPPRPPDPPPPEKVAGPSHCGSGI